MGKASKGLSGRLSNKSQVEMMMMMMEVEVVEMMIMDISFALQR